MQFFNVFQARGRFEPAVALLLLLTAHGMAFGQNASTSESAVSGMPFTVFAADGVSVYGDRYDVGNARATIVLFHQGGANVRGEYAAIIPRLLSEGFSVVAADLRRGGQLFGSWNRTVAETSPAESYCEAEADVDAVLEYALDQAGASPVILWGSSYSAALVIRAADRHPDGVAAVLAFSPASGESMDGCRPEEVFDRLDAPLLVLRPAREVEIASVREQLDVASAAGHEVYVAAVGTHGSSMLVEERVGSDVEENWRRVMSFLDEMVQ
jgi:pimeloyl-ACP methyl ester carboxylesterase